MGQKKHAQGASIASIHSKMCGTMRGVGGELAGPSRAAATATELLGGALAAPRLGTRAPIELVSVACCVKPAGGACSCSGLALTATATSPRSPSGSPGARPHPSSSLIVPHIFEWMLAMLARLGMFFLAHARSSMVIDS